MAAREIDESRRPVVALQVAQVAIAGKQILVDDTVMPAIHTVSSFHLVGVTQAGRDVFEPGVVKLVRGDLR
jgi:hypothetical protein